MKIEEQVLSIEQMQHLKELGLEVEDTALAWVNARVGHDFVAPIDIIFHNDYIPTLTLQEILEMLPEEIRFEEQRAFLIIDKADRQISYTAEDYDGNLNIDCMFFENESLLQAAYNTLCWCAENGFLNASNSKPLK